MRVAKTLSVAGVLILASLIIIAFLASSAEREPRVLVDEARHAVEAAKQAEADIYTPELYKAARTVLDSALADIDREKAKPLEILRYYGRARKMLLTARGAADSARVQVDDNRERVNREIRALVTQAESRLARVRDRPATQRRFSASAAERYRAALDSLEMLVELARFEMDNGRFGNAQRKAREVLERVERMGRNDG